MCGDFDREDMNMLQGDGIFKVVLKTMALLECYEDYYEDSVRDATTLSRN